MNIENLVGLGPIVPQEEEASTPWDGWIIKDKHQSPRKDGSPRPLIRHQTGESTAPSSLSRTSSLSSVSSISTTPTSAWTPISSSSPLPRSSSVSHPHEIPSQPPNFAYNVWLPSFYSPTSSPVASPRASPSFPNQMQSSGVADSSPDQMALAQTQQKRVQLPLFALRPASLDEGLFARSLNLNASVSPRLGSQSFPLLPIVPSQQITYRSPADPSRLILKSSSVEDYRSEEWEDTTQNVSIVMHPNELNLTDNSSGEKPKMKNNVRYKRNLNSCIDHKRKHQRCPEDCPKRLLSATMAAKRNRKSFSMMHQ
eukprot:TRINITY_DN13900_c0_g1_i1.p1 TRINITY_DN13900_c0_g1~~TRINITY_DN13900_c0_g1_i1.p1  ORF type:complete len:312 (+),score=50.16 TRINITY_DN13900_c0_g1_i1:261-1196(+)